MKLSLVHVVLVPLVVFLTVGTIASPILKHEISIKSTKTALKSPGYINCTGGSATCADGNTCCKLTSGQWGCCPLPNAICCSDGLHCCPQGYTCEAGSDTCTKGEESIPFFNKIAALKSVPNPPINKVECPDKTTCPIDNVCCETSQGKYGCCPQNNGVCCADGQHCCPDGYTCDITDQKCNKAKGTDVFTNLVLSPENVVCPDGQSECPTGNTCCKLGSGQWGCCPLPSAVCCSDGVHCCPNGYTCDTSAGTCTKREESIPFFNKIAAFKSSENAVCPDGQSECRGGQTCCKARDGTWGCCPLPGATCCSDGLYCCPHAYYCANSMCFREKSIPIFAQTLAAVRKPLKPSDFL